MKILIIDDSATMRGVIKDVIENNASGLKIDFIDASNGNEALDLLEKSEIDLIIVDWNMPVLDGLSFVKMIRNARITKPVVMVSSVVSEEKILEAFDAGINVYVEKPIRGSDLWEDIKEFVK